MLIKIGNITNFNLKLNFNCYILIKNYLLKSYKAVSALSYPTEIYIGLVSVLGLVERTFRGHGRERSVGLHEQVLIGIIALFERHDEFVLLVCVVVFHLVLRQEPVVRPHTIDIDGRGQAR